MTSITLEIGKTEICTYCGEKIYNNQNMVINLYYGIIHHWWCHKKWIEETNENENV